MFSRVDGVALLSSSVPFGIAGRLPGSCTPSDWEQQCRINSAEALPACRFRRGVKILLDPYLLLRFLRIRPVSQRLLVFAAFFLDRKQRLIRFSEIACGENDRVAVHRRRSCGTR